MRALLTASALSLGLATGASASTLGEMFTSFFVIGDSNSDFGNFGPDGPQLPYFNSQFSNGPVWADILDVQFGDGNLDDLRTWNYAFGGARVVGGEAPDMPSQIGLFLNDLDPNIDDPLDGTPEVGDRPLISVWFGANDVRAVYQNYLADREVLLQASLTDEEFASELEAAKAQARAEIASLGSLHGDAFEFLGTLPNFNDFLAFTTADAAKTPEYTDPIDGELLTELSIIFNDALTAKLDALQEQGEFIYLIDIAGLLEQAQANGAAFGFTNTTDACFVIENDIPTICDNPDEYLFWDQIGHLSGAGHQALAGIVEQTVTARVVPLPAASLSLLAGLFALGAVARRRRT